MSLTLVTNGSGSAARPSYLNQETDFVKLFEYYAGVSEVPPNFIYWGGISLIAACLAERSWQCFIAEDVPLYPNLFVFLLGDSGTGKGITCDLVTSFFPTNYIKAQTGFEESRTTAQGVMDRLARRFEKKGSYLEFIHSDRATAGQLEYVEVDEEDQEERLAAQKRMYLVFEELAASVGVGPRAVDFVQFLTKVYGGKGYVDRTRTHGVIDFSGLVSINMLAGSTHRWLKSCMDIDAILGGFFARVAIVDGDTTRNPLRRVYRPSRPPDHKLIREHLEERVDMMLNLRGEFRTTVEADELGERWYMERPSPELEIIGPIWRREKVLMLKLAHIFAVAEMLPTRRCDFKIHTRHVARAQEAIRSLEGSIMRVVATTSVTRDTQGLFEVKDFILQNGPVSRASTARYASSLGIGADRLRAILQSLSDHGELIKGSGPGGTQLLSIKKKSTSALDQVSDDDEDDSESGD